MLERLRSLLEDADRPRRVNEPGWEKDDFGVAEFNPVHLTSNFWQRAIAQLFGWDYAAKMRRRVAVDAQGRLYVVSGGVASYTPQIYQVSVSTSATQVAQSKPNRLFVLLKNVGGEPVWIGITNAVASSNGYKLNPGDELKLDSWTQEVWAIAQLSGSTLCVIEG